MEPRLTPFSGYSPCTLRGKPRDLLPESVCSPLPGQTFRSLLRQTSNRIREEAAGLPPAVTLHATGILSLIDGSREELPRAVRALEEARARDPQDARILNDLAAAYDLRAHREARPWDMVLALSAVEQALRFDPNLLAARFNRALFLQKLSMRHAARRAWTHYLAMDVDSPWADEARKSWMELTVAGRNTREEVRTALQQATARPPAELARLVRQAPQEARLLAEELLLGSWARALVGSRLAEADDHLRQARRLGDALARITRDQMVRDSVAAIDRARESATIDRLAEGHRLYADALIAMEDRRFAEAEPLLRDALRTLDRRSPFALWVRFALMRCAFQDWRHDESLAIGEEVLASAGQGRYPSLAGRASWVRATTLMSLGRSEEAAQAYRQALARFEMTGETGYQATVLGHLATVLDYVGAPLEAWEHRHRALKLYAGRGDNRQLRLLLTAAAASALENGQPDAALAMLDEVVALAAETQDPMSFSTALLHRARARRSVGSEAAARRDLERAEDLCERISQVPDQESLRGEIFLERGRLELNSDPAAAVALLTESESIFIANDYPLHLPRLYHERARAHLRLEQDSAAEQDFVSSIAALEDQRADAGDTTRRVSFLDRRSDILEEMMIFQVDRRKHGDAALDVAETARGRVLLDWLAQLTPSLASRTSDGPSARARKWQELRPLLPDRTVFLQYEVTRDRLLIWILGPDGLRLQQVHVSPADLKAKVARFHRLRSVSAGRQALRSAAADLFDLLIRPVQTQLPPDSRWIISADEVLHQVPFAALVDRESGRFLIQDAQISMAPSLNAYLGEPACTAGRNDFRAADLLVVADPSFDPDLYSRLAPLEGAAEEGKMIAGLYPGSRTLFGEAATRTRLLQEISTAEVFHFAGHALANSQSSMLSSLVLAGQDSWPAREILAHPFPRTRLVVLASCRSAGAPSSETEGILGLAWPFLARGVPFVIASLWDVDDTATAGLFTDFYQHLRQGAEPEIALRQAQLAALTREDQDPGNALDWAAFQLFTAGQARCRP